MSQHIIRSILILCIQVNVLTGQSILPGVPATISKSDQYLCYLHSGLVSLFGNNAINQSRPEWGPYEYYNILDSLSKRGFRVISEIRSKAVSDSAYAFIVSRQIDTLLKRGARPKNILVAGASSGWDIVMRVSAMRKESKLNYVIMGGCRDNDLDYKTFVLHGHFLSIIEKSDPHGTCHRLFENKKHLKSHTEVLLNTGLSHGFLYKGHKEWIDPIVIWSHR
jgi:hypothetical protein